MNYNVTSLRYFQLEGWQSWSIASVLKTEERETVPWVRILLLPQKRSNRKPFGI